MQIFTIMVLLVGCATGITDREMVVRVTSVTASILLPDGDLPIQPSTRKATSQAFERTHELSPDDKVRVRVVMKAVKQEAFDPKVLVRIFDLNEGTLLKEEKYDKLDFLRDFAKGQTVDVVLANASCLPLLVTVSIGLGGRGTDYRFKSMCRK